MTFLQEDIRGIPHNVKPVMFSAIDYGKNRGYEYMYELFKEDKLIPIFFVCFGHTYIQFSPT